MELMNELEADLLGSSETTFPTFVSIKTLSGDCDLRMPQLGTDYLAGLSNGVLVVVPLRNVLEIQGSRLPVFVDRNMIEFLERQRTPIRLRLYSGVGGDCWLLNIEASWLRIALGQGVSWVPLCSIQSIEILPVDNSNH